MTLRAKELRTNPTAAEDRLWSIVRARRLAGLKFRRQHVLGRYIADFVCIRALLVIEVDGETHGNDEAEVRDAKRSEEIERAGFRVIRFWDDYVLNDREGGVAETILDAMRTSALPAHEKARLVAEGWVDEPGVSTPLSLTLSPAGRGDALLSRPTL